jgi:hypothetical protein
MLSRGVNVRILRAELGGTREISLGYRSEMTTPRCHAITIL